MARQYSQPTLASLIRLLAEYKMDPLTLLFVEASVPRGFDPRESGAGRLGRALTVVNRLTEDLEYGDTLDRLFDVVIAENRSLFDPYSIGLPSEIYDDDPSSAPPSHSLLRALRMDGYDIREGRIVPLEDLEAEMNQEISMIYRRIEVLGWEDIRRNLKQAHENYVNGNYESCNAMLRTALEATLLHIATDLAGGVDNIPNSNAARLEAGHVRNYLRQQAFTSEDEHQFVRTLYGFASPEGSHPGISNEVESRLRRLMIVGCMQYCLEKFIARTS
jgi:hypothetical protein